MNKEERSLFYEFTKNLCDLAFFEEALIWLSALLRDDEEYQRTIDVLSFRVHKNRSRKIKGVTTNLAEENQIANDIYELCSMFFREVQEFSRNHEIKAKFGDHIKRLYDNEEIKSNSHYLYSNVRTQLENLSRLLGVSLFDLPNNKPLEVLDELAQYLAYNYVTISFGNRYIVGNREIDPLRVDEILVNKQGFRRIRCRNILIVGAGATYDAFNVLPFGEEMLKQIRVLLEEKEGKLFKTSQEEFDQILNGPNAFERGMSFLAHNYPQNAIKDILKNYYDIRFRPNLGFEIMAHLFKHGYVDAIFNFNFDELLDKAIEGEIGSAPPGSRAGDDGGGVT